MKKNNSWVFIALLILIGISYIMSKRNPPPTPMEQAETVVVEQVTQEPPLVTESDGVLSGPGALQAIISRGGDYQCAAVSSIQGTAMQGTMYVMSGGTKLRGDFVTQIQGEDKVVDAHVFYSDGFTYIWSRALPQGIKMKAEVDTIASNYADFNYQCAPWSVDNAVFELPEGMTFQEVG